MARDLKAEALNQAIPTITRRKELPHGKITMTAAVEIWRGRALESKPNLLAMLDMARVNPPKGYESFTETTLSRCKQQFPAAFDDIISAFDTMPTAEQKQIAYEAFSYLIDEICLLSIIAPTISLHAEAEKIKNMRELQLTRKRNSATVAKRRQAMCPLILDVLKDSENANASEVFKTLWAKTAFRSEFSSSRNTILTDIKAIIKYVNSEQS